MLSSEELKAALSRVASMYRSNSIERNYLNGIALRPHLLNQILQELKRPSIRCPKCGMVSFNQGDVQYKYCGNCNQFHEDMKEKDND